MRDLEDHTLIVLLIAVSVAFAWILWPFYGAILWATVLAIVFAPLYRWLSSAMGQHRSLAAIASVDRIARTDVGRGRIEAPVLVSPSRRQEYFRSTSDHLRFRISERRQPVRARSRMAAMACQCSPGPSAALRIVRAVFFWRKSE